jgi:hypothetical protein
MTTPKRSIIVCAIALVAAAIVCAAILHARATHANACRCNLRAIAHPYLCLTGVDPDVLRRTDLREPELAARLLVKADSLSCPSGAAYSFSYRTNDTFYLYATCPKHGDLVRRHGDPAEPLNKTKEMPNNT